MDNQGVSTADVLALTRNNGNNDSGFSLNGVGGFILLFIFLIALFDGLAGNNNAPAQTQMQLSDINMVQYLQTQDSTLRNLAQSQANMAQQIMSSNYDNAMLMKDLSYQLSNSIAGINNQILNNTIREMGDKLQVTRDALNNKEQTETLSNQMYAQTNQILNSLGRYVQNPPCNYNYCNCGTNLY